MNGTHAATASTANPASAIARPIGDSHIHKPSHETVRKIPTAVASVASGGHSRSQKPVHRARRSARSRISPVSRGTDEFTGLSISGISFSGAVFQRCIRADSPPHSFVWRLLFVVLTRIGLIFVVRKAFFSRDLAASDDARLQVSDHGVDFVERQRARSWLQIARPDPLRTPVTLTCRVGFLVE